MAENQNGKVAVNNGEDRTESRCGLGPWKPNFLQKFIDIRIFLFAFAVGFFSYGSQSSYLSASLTNMEKALKINSAKSGLLTIANDMGYIMTVLLVSSFANRAHKPRVIGFCITGIGIFSICVSLPYFIFGGEMMQPTQNRGSNITKSMTSFCLANRTSSECKSEKSIEENFQSSVSYGIVFAAQFLLGICMTPIWAYGMTYLDDNSGSKHASPLYIGLMFSVRAVSPVVGYIIGGAFARIPVNFEATDLSPRDPGWIGAWWLGFIVFGGALFTASFPIAMFPRYIKKRDTSEDMHLGKAEKEADKKQGGLQSFLNDNDDGGNDKIDWKELPRSIKRLICNPAWVAHLFGSFTTWLCLSGTTKFLAKYMEKVFHISASEASTAMGIAGAVPFALATVAGGIMTSRMKMTPTTMAKTVFITQIVAFGIYFFMFIFWCPPVDYEGLNGDRWDVKNTCNQNCSCSDMYYSPVCSEGSVYFSPCHAGCTSSPEKKMYGNCSCVLPDRNETVASHGICGTDCQMFIPFVAIVFIGTFVQMLGIIPGTMIYLRVVEPRDKPVCIAVYSSFGSLLALPSPILFGAAIDATCIRHDPCNSDVCFAYDTDLLKWYFHGMAQIMRFCGIPLHLLAWYFIWKKAKKDTKKQEKANKTENTEL